MSESALLRHPWRIVAGLTLVAAVVRIIGLDGGMWIDEVYSLLDSFRPPLRTVLTEFPGDTQHPLYSVFANLARGTLGESEWVIRLPAMLFGVASIPMLYALGARVTSIREALLASALLALSYHHVWFSQNARGYTMIAFWALLSTYLLYRGLREGGRGRFVWYGVVIGLGVYTHLTMVFVVAGQALVGLVWTLRYGKEEGVGRFPDAVLGLGVGVVTGALLYAPIFMQVLDFFLNKPSQLEGVSTPGWALVEAVRVLGIGMGAWLGVLIGGGMFAAGALSYAKRDGLFFSLCALPVVVTLVGALAARGTMYPRFFFFVAGFALLIAIRGVTVVTTFAWARIAGSSDEAASRGLAIATAVSILMVLGSAVTVRANYAAPKQDFGGALAYVEAQATPGELIATVGVTTLPYERYYERPFPEILDFGSVQELRATGERLWVLFTFVRYIEASDAELARSLQEECRREAVFPGTVGGGDIIVCSYPPSVEGPSGATP